ncbi:MAG: hypothetical protein LBK29_01670 [Oscillospiraceae bacterium]|jgi:hypothetical protein|nr:hypothetical protein [Oscillospiraceae bacterium]
MKIENLLSDSKFVSKIMLAQTEDEVRTLFSVEGVKLSDKQLARLKKIFSKILNNLLNKLENKELSTEQLVEISGGLNSPNLNNFLESAIIFGLFSAIVGGVIGSNDNKGNSRLKKQIKNTMVGVAAGALVGAATGVGVSGILRWLKI